MTTSREEIAKNGGAILLGITTDWVLRLRPDLTKEQAIDVLHNMAQEWDPRPKMRYETLTYYIDKLFPKPARDAKARTDLELTRYYQNRKLKIEVEHEPHNYSCYYTFNQMAASDILCLFERVLRHYRILIPDSRRGSYRCHCLVGWAYEDAFHAIVQLIDDYRRGKKTTAEKPAMESFVTDCFQILEQPLLQHGFVMPEENRKEPGPFNSIATKELSKAISTFMQTEFPEVFGEVEEPAYSRFGPLNVQTPF